MIVRRRFNQTFSFLAAAFLLTTAGSVHAQKPGPSSPGQHEALPGTALTPDQVKAALERFSRGGGPELPPELLKQMERDGKKFDEKQLKNALELMQRDPELRKQVEEMGRKLRNNGGGKNPIAEEERRQFEKWLQSKDGQPFGNPMPGGLEPPPLRKPGDPKLPNGGNAMPPMPNAGPNPIPPPPFDPNQNKLPPNLFDPKPERPPGGAQVIASLWERNIGPLDETPGVRNALFDLVEGSEELRDENGKSFWDDLALEKGDATSLSELLDGASLGDSWTFPKFDLSLNWGNDRDTDVGSGSSASGDSWWKRMTGGDRSPSSSSSRSPSSGSGGFNIGIPGLEGTLWPVVILAVLLFGSLVVWRLWGWKRARDAAAALGLGGPGWPIDPRRITTREHVVLAFEYLSVLICGPTAKTWTHNTIAEALSELAATHGETAIMLARLYELARYAPLDEPLTTAELAEARRLVCALAGLEHE